MIATSWVLGLVYLVGAVPDDLARLPVPRRTTRSSPAGPATRRATWRRPSRSRCTASGCSRPSAAATTPSTTSCGRPTSCATTEVRQGAHALAGVVRARCHPGGDPRGLARVRRGAHVPRRAQRRRPRRVLRHRRGGEQPGGAARHAAGDDARRQGRRPTGTCRSWTRARPSQDPETPVALPAADPAGSRVELRGRPLRAPGRGRRGEPRGATTSWRASTWCSSRGRRWRSSGSPAAARRPCSSSSRACTTSPRAAS